VRQAMRPQRSVSRARRRPVTIRRSISASESVCSSEDICCRFGRRIFRQVMARPQRFCIFCDGPHLSKTHIWPEWLNTLLQPPGTRLEELDHARIISNRKSRIREGSIFTQKPYLCCITCNTGWMRKFEDEMCSFAKPLFAPPTGDVILDDTKQRILAVWVALITILAEFIDRDSRYLCFEGRPGLS
jgi:hypothetical protein